MTPEQFASLSLGQTVHVVSGPVRKGNLADAPRMIRAARVVDINLSGYAWFADGQAIFTGPPRIARTVGSCFLTRREAAIEALRRIDDAAAELRELRSQVEAVAMAEGGAL